LLESDARALVEATPYRSVETRTRANLQTVFHLLERNVCLLKETVDDTPAKFFLVVVVIHFENLLENKRVDVITTFWKGLRSILAL
jgi:hypothetical protein